MAKVFITGIAGFLGSHLADSLLAEGHEVYGCDNLLGGDVANVAHLDKKVIWYHQDCATVTPTALKALGIEVLYHCAAAAHEGLSVFSPGFIFNNVAGASVSVFSAAIAAGVNRIVYLSSMARYGKGWDEEGARKDESPPFREDFHGTQPVDPYGHAKVAAENVLRTLCELHKVEFQIAVPHNIIGPRQCYTDPYRNVISIWMNRLKQGKPGIIYGDGTQVRCFSPVQDILPCLVKLGFENLPNGEVWNLGPDTSEITIAEAYEAVLAVAMMDTPPEFMPGRPAEVKHATCSATKSRKGLGYEEGVLLFTCLEQMWNAIPDGGKPFRYDNYPLEIVSDLTPTTWKDRLI
jgi:UDP-glucose 4-epimerase